MSTPPHVPLCFGLVEGTLLHVRDIPELESHQVLCSECHQPLRIVKRDGSPHHLAHHRKGSCVAPGPTSLVCAVSQALTTTSTIRLPAFTIDIGQYRASWVLRPARDMTLDEVVRYDSAPEGAVVFEGRHGGRSLFIVLHHGKVTIGEPWRVADDLPSSSILVNLEHVDVYNGWDAIHGALSGEAPSQSVFNSQIRWLKNTHLQPKADHVLQDMRERSLCLPTQSRGFARHADNCPKSARSYRGQPYANVMDDCIPCDHFVDVDHGVNGDICRVYCGFHTGIDTFEEWKVLSRV